jgi:hypothetical protein
MLLWQEHRMVGTSRRTDIPGRPGLVLDGFESFFRTFARDAYLFRSGEASASKQRRKR